MAAALALMPYLLAFVVEQGLMLALYLRSIHAILPQRLALLCALAMPSVVINMGYGQVGSLTAGLAGLTAANIDKRPLLSGVLFACMAYKPQLGLAIPIALLAGRCWATIAAASLTVAMLGLVSTAVYGWHSWTLFATNLKTAGDVVFSLGRVEWFKFESVYGALRLLGAGPVPAWAMQGLAIIGALAGVVWMWWHDNDRRLQMAFLMIAGLLCTPYCFAYDLVVLGPAVALVVSHGLERGFLPWQKTMLATCAAAPLFESLAAEYLSIPLGPIMLIGFATFILVRTQRDERKLFSGMIGPVPGPIHAQTKQGTQYPQCAGTKAPQGV